MKEENTFKNLFKIKYDVELLEILQENKRLKKEMKDKAKKIKEN